MDKNVNSALDNFLDCSKNNQFEKQTEDGSTQICDIKTGECHTIPSKDGLIERVDKTFITKEGKILLND